MLKNKVQIFLSTYNGAEYIEAQIESILNQDYSNWELLIRDDGSTDNTVSLIEKLRSGIDNIQLIESGPNLGATDSFLKLLKNASASYLMLCDQDDVWHPEKISRSIERLMIAEKEDPLALVYTDMEVVNKNLELIDESFLKQHHLRPEWSQYPYYTFAQSMAAGCSMIFTKALAEKLHPVNSKLFQHDHWILMHAAYYGKVAFYDWKSLKYRQHGTNSIGSHGVSKIYFIGKIFSINQVIARWNYIRQHFRPAPIFSKIMWAKVSLNLKRISA